MGLGSGVSRQPRTRGDELSKASPTLLGEFPSLKLSCLSTAILQQGELLELPPLDLMVKMPRDLGEYLGSFTPSKYLFKDCITKATIYIVLASARHNAISFNPFNRQELLLSPVYK